MEDRVYVIKRNDGWYMSNFDDDDVDNKKVYWVEKLRDAEFYSAGMIIEADYNDLPEKERKQSRIVEIKIVDNSINSLFKVGDKVITFSGLKGVITKICDCERCRKRGFLEADVKYENGDEEIITHYDFVQGFRLFYSIGDKIYGNLMDIEYLIDNIKDCEEMIKRFKKQIKSIEKLKLKEKQ